ncbi:hypothetical protein FIC_01457 [Flavobacteriaceae bacterium 3519-10]|nr:hypothetical protein FIC_01457 [Flavobacteriaceae bacterium 3519-10]
MKTIEIRAVQFFELLKMRDASMWEIFAQMIDGEEKELIFIDDEKKVLFNYILPQNLEKLNEDRAKFSQEYSDKIAGLN